MGAIRSLFINTGNSVNFLWIPMFFKVSTVKR